MKKVKILSIVGIMLAMGIVACGGKPSEQPSNSGADDSSDVQPSSSDEPVDPADLCEHDFSVKLSEAAAADGSIAFETYACAQNCGRTAVRWNAIDYDETETAARSGEGKGPESRDSGAAIRFSDEVQYKGVKNDSGVYEPVETTKGCHIVYKVKTPAGKTVGLALFSTARTTDNPIPPVFDKVEGDTSQGFEKVNGEFVRPDSRYGLKVDGQLLPLSADGQQFNGKTWYQMPVVIPELTAGVHEFEIFNYGGYRVDMYNFQLTNLPAVEGSTFVLNEGFQKDETGHWKTAQGQDGVKFQFAEHDWEEGAVVVADGKGSQTFTCKTCGQTKVVSGGVYGSFKWADALQDDSETLDGAKFKASSTYNLRVFNVPAAGVYTLALQMKGSSGNGGRVMNPADGQNKGQGFSISANGVAGVFYGDGKTYTEFFGEDQAAWVDIVFGEVTLVAGVNVISIVTDTGGYRVSMNVDVNLTLAAKAAA